MSDIAYVMILTAILAPAIPTVNAFKRDALRRFIVVLTLALLFAGANITLVVMNEHKHQREATEEKNRTDEAKKQAKIASDQNSDLQARLVQQTEQMRVLQRCVANPKSDNCSKDVGARLNRGTTAEVHTDAQVTVFKVTRGSQKAH